MTQVKALVDALDAFVVGCKADGTWSAIKASCIMAAWSNLNGALVPLVGTAPTNFNFVAGDYNRKTGLLGDGSTKYLNSNRNNNADPQDSSHNAVFVSTAQVTSLGNYIGTATGAGSNSMGQNIAVVEVYARNRTLTGSTVAGSGLGFMGHSRSSSAALNVRVNGANNSFSVASETPLSSSITIFNRNLANYSNARLAFYSIGESLNLALLDARVTTLINAISAAIP